MNASHLTSSHIKKENYMINMLIQIIAIAMSVGTGHAAPTKCPKDNSILGYSSWTKLKADVLNPTRSVFTICPGTTFHLDPNANNPALILNHDKSMAITIQCGPDGKSSDSCVVDGGHHHVWIDQTGDTTFMGLTFTNADRGSVWTGQNQDQVHFEDCVWKVCSSLLWSLISYCVCPVV